MLQTTSMITSMEMSTHRQLSNDDCVILVEPSIINTKSISASSQPETQKNIQY